MYSFLAVSLLEPQPEASCCSSDARMARSISPRRPHASKPFEIFSHCKHLQTLAALAKQSLALWPPPCINMAWVTVGDITPPLSTRELVSGKPTNPRMHSLLACSPTPRTIYRCQSGLFLHRYCLNGLMIAPRSHSCPAFILLCACVCVGMYVRQGHDEIGRCALGEGAYQCPWG